MISGDDFMTNIGARIYKARQASGMTAENLARRLGISVQKVSEWENGGTEPSAQNIFSLYGIFGQKLFSDGGNITGDKSNRPCMESIKEIYKIGRGPSSSHTIGPERACKRLKALYPNANRYKITLFGSLAKTGKGHGTDVVITETLKPADVDIVFDNATQTPHPNTMRITAFEGENVLGENEVRSIGGGDIVFDNERAAEKKTVYQHRSFSDISNYCKSRNISLWEYANGRESGLMEYLGTVWRQMTQSVERGIHDEGILPGGLGVHKKAKQLFEAQHIEEPEIKRKSSNLRLCVRRQRTKCVRTDHCDRAYLRCGGRFACGAVLRTAEKRSFGRKDTAGVGNSRNNRKYHKNKRLDLGRGMRLSSRDRERVRDGCRGARGTV
mgnify:CR=1 FL=1